MRRILAVCRRGCQKGLLLWSRRAAEDRIAMGKAAEARDLLAIATWMGQHTLVYRHPWARRIAHAFFQSGDAAILNRQILRVLERRNDEQELLEVEPDVIVAIERLEGERQGLGIAGKGRRRVAREVARELIEHDDERASPTRRLRPLVELARQRARHQVAEP